MNMFMALGFGIMAVGGIIVLALLIKWSWIDKDFAMRRRVLLLLILAVFVIGGGILAQTGETQVRTQFSESELNLVESDKSFSDFSAEEKKMFAMVKYKFFAGDEEKMSVYHDRILDLAIEEYLADNTDRTDLTRSDVKEFILRDWALRIIN